MLKNRTNNHFKVSDLKRNYAALGLTETKLLSKISSNAWINHVSTIALQDFLSLSVLNRAYYCQQSNFIANRHRLSNSMLNLRSRVKNEYVDCYTKSKCQQKVTYAFYAAALYTSVRKIRKFMFLYILSLKIPRSIKKELWVQKTGMKMVGCTCEGLWYRNTLSYIYLTTQSRLTPSIHSSNPNLNNSVIGTCSLSVLHIHIKMLQKRLTFATRKVSI